MILISTRRHLLVCSSFAIALLAVACGGADAPPAAKSPAAPSSEPAPQSKKEVEYSEPSSVEEAQAQIARLRDNLQSPPAPEAPADSRPSKAPDKPDSAREEHLNVNTCGNPCRALASMKRAVDALCRMTGDTDNRCLEAKRTLSESATRVSSCKCSNN